MSHAEKCPVCDGSGRIGTERPGRKDCHGCDGKGWVEVADTLNPCPIQPPGPTTYPWPIYPPGPIITVGPWVYETGTYSANVEVNIKGL